MSRQFTWSFDIIGQTLGHRNCTPAVIERFFDLSSLRSSYHGGAREDSDKSSLPRKARDDDACLAEEKSLPPQVATKLARQTTRFQLWNALPLFLPPPLPLLKMKKTFLARFRSGPLRARELATSCSSTTFEPLRSKLKIPRNYLETPSTFSAWREINRSFSHTMVMGVLFFRSSPSVW